MRRSRAARLGILGSKLVMVVIRSAHLLLKVASRLRCSDRTSRTPNCARVNCVPECSTVRIESAELAGLELALDLRVDLVLGRVRVDMAQLPRAQTAQLEDLE